MLGTKLMKNPEIEIQFGVSRRLEWVKRLICGVNRHQPLLEFWHSRL